MRKRCFCLPCWVAITWIVFNGAAFSMAFGQEHGKDHVMIVGKTGEMTFNKETMVGDLTLKPGRYKFQHRVEGDDHFVHFTEWTKSTPHGDSGSPKAHPGEVKCRLEPLNEKAKRTEVYLATEGDMQRVTRIVVAGENVAHVF